MSGGTSGPASVGRQDTLANSFLQRQKLGGARSTLRAAIHTPGKVRRAEDCTLDPRSSFGRAKISKKDRGVTSPDM